MDNTRSKTGIYSCFTLLSLLATPIFAAANFNIDYTPGQPIPSTISSGTVSAYYTITNNTKTTRAGYVVSGLPATVTQNAGAGYCSNPVTLAGHASCILKLDITGQVKSYFSLCRGASCTQAARPLSVTAPTTSFTPLVAGGIYLNTQNQLYPLVAASGDNGTTWAYTLSSGPSNTVTQTAYCKKNTCFAGGGNSSSPVIYTSSTGGLTWTLSNVPLPHNYLEEGYFTATSCNENACISSGDYRTVSNTTPMIATSQNNGASWVYTLDDRNVPADFEGLSSADTPNSLSCTTNYCVYAKAYLSNTDFQNYPLVATSNSQGTNWAYTLTSNSGTNFPAGFSSFRIGAPGCHNNICIVVGTYSTPDLPIIFTGTNNGTVWAYTLDGTSMPTLTATSASMNGAQCNDQYCIASGSYIDGGVTYPMIATSTDSSATSWNYSFLTPPSDLDTQGSLGPISCSGTYCVSIGAYSATDGHTYPMIVTSKDSGLHWEYTLDSNTPLPAGITDIVTYGVSCSKNFCITSGGANFAGGDLLSYPILLLSTDYGMTWSYKVTNSTPQLPSGFNIGFFTASASGSASFLPKSLKFLVNQ